MLMLLLLLHIYYTFINYLDRFKSKVKCLFVYCLDQTLNFGHSPSRNPSLFSFYSTEITMENYSNEMCNNLWSQQKTK